MKVNFDNKDELKHYGVLGMRWGVRRATNRLSKATTKEERDAAIAKLNKHRTKASAKVAKLDKKRVKLQKEADKYILKKDAKANKLSEKSAKLKRKSLKRWVSEDKAAELMSEAMRLDIKADTIRARSQTAKSKLENNKRMAEIFNSGINTIDRALIDKGKACVGRN